jgi:hypothetical protein
LPETQDILIEKNYAIGHLKIALEYALKYPYPQSAAAFKNQVQALLNYK